jgi:bifunctional protein TilS/HprT
VTGAEQEATGTPQPIGGDQPTSNVDATRFAHASEAEMARILDFYAVRWAYEPQVFPILWNLDGDVVESFAPDFYLPELGVFLEMTTLKQRLVRKKNRKLRRLRELYPDVRIKLFYARDFRAMMLKYGRLGLAASLSGTTGQMVPDRPVAAPEEVVEPLLAIALAAGEPAADADPIPVPSPTERIIDSQPRATPRARSGRRRRRAGSATEAGAEREAKS